MANRNFKPGADCIEKGSIKLYGRAIVIDGAGAITDYSRGFALERTGVGAYDVVLEDNYNYMMNLTAQVQGANTGGITAIVTGDASSTATKTITIQFLDGAGLSAEVADTHTIYLEVTLKNSSVEY